MIRIYKFINILTGEIYTISVNLDEHKIGFMYAHAQAHKYFSDTIEYCTDVCFMSSEDLDGNKLVDHWQEVYYRMLYR